MEVPDAGQPFRIRAVSSALDLEAAYAIRFEVFVREQGVPPWEEIDAYDECAFHFLAERDGVAVGTARLVALDGGVGKIGRVAVMASHRRTGVGVALMRELMRIGLEKNEELILESQVEAIGFYARLGFTSYGERFWDCGIEHQRMRLRRTALDSQTPPVA